MNLKEVKWNNKTYQEFLTYLESIKDPKYQEFNQKIVFTKYKMLGIRLPELRKIANNIFKGDYKNFLKLCSNEYYETVMLKGLVIAKISTFSELEPYFNSYLSLIDNWALTDTFCNSLKLVKSNKEEFLSIINSLLETNEEYKVRVGLVLFLNYYVEEPYLDLIFSYLDNLNTDFYYVNMAAAWLLCEIFTKYPEITLKYLENNNLNTFTINKTISKIRDSYKIDKKMKDYVLKFKRIED